MQNRRDQKEGVDWKLYLHQLAGVLVRFVAVWLVLLYLVVSGLLGAWFAFGVLFAP